jgi:hypothetical protein
MKISPLDLDSHCEFIVLWIVTFCRARGSISMSVQQTLQQIKPGAGLIACLCAIALAGAARADVVVRQFASGSGQNAVGIVDASQDTEIDGPQALTTDEKGNVYLLDQVNGRVVQFDPKNPAADPRILRIPPELEPTDLLVRRSDILLWDGAVHTLQPAPSPDGASTRGLEEVSTRAADDQTVLSAFAQMGSVDPGSASDLLDENTRSAATRHMQPRSRQHVASRGAGSLVVDVVGESAAASRVEVRHVEEASGEPFVRLSLKVRDRLGTVEFLEVDNTGRMFVFAENIPAAYAGAGAFVARYSSAGALEGIYELPLSNVPLSRRFVTVSGDGDVYFLRTQSGKVEVLGVGFRPIANRGTIDVRGAPLGGAKFDNAGPIAAVRPLTRQQVIATAFAFEGIQWQVNAAAYGGDPDTVCTGFAGRVRRPGYLHGKLGQQVRGIPYCWGCYGSLDQIRTKIERGVLAGNICTHNAPRPDVVGVDCSAFVSAAWGLSHQYTTDAIPAIAQRLSNAWDLRPGDALDKPGSHVMLFLRFTPDRMAEVMESSPGACNGRVCRNVYPLASLLARGYQPVRFRALENDTAVVAQTETPGRPGPGGSRSQRR